MYLSVNILVKKTNYKRFGLKLNRKELLSNVEIPLFFCNFSLIEHEFPKIGGFSPILVLRGHGGHSHPLNDDFFNVVSATNKRKFP